MHPTLALLMVTLSILVAGTPAPRAAEPGAWLAPAQLRQRVAEHVADRETLARLIPRQPVLGGAWFVGSPRDIFFVAPGVVAIDYEDGHIAGRLVVRIHNVNDPSTWELLEDRER